jgi:hypothetical protein
LKLKENNSFRELTLKDLLGLHTLNFHMKIVFKTVFIIEWATRLQTPYPNTAKAIAVKPEIVVEVSFDRNWILKFRSLFKSQVWTLFKDVNMIFRLSTRSSNVSRGSS